MAEACPRATAALPATLGFITVHLVPSLKYPAPFFPLSVGDPDTMGLHTALHFSMIATSLIAMNATGKLRRLLHAPLGAWTAALAAAGCYVVAIVAAGSVFPMINEVPAEFPATATWQFRVASSGAQIIAWATIGLHGAQPNGLPG